MICIGDKRLRTCYLGDTAIGKVYWGDKLLFSGKKKYKISASIDPEGGGAVTGAGTYLEGEPVTLSAAPGDGYSFVAWQENGETVSEDAEYTFTVTSNRVLTAVFEEEQTGRLPKGYLELEYVQTDIQTVLPTGITSTTRSTRIVIDITPMEKVAYYRYLFLSSDSLGNMIALRQNNVANQMWIVCGAALNNSLMTTFTYNMVSEKRITIDFNTETQKVKMGSSTFSFKTASVDAYVAPIVLGGLYYSSAYYPALVMKIHSCQIYIGGILKADLIPCERKEDGRLGIFNLVDGKFVVSDYGSLIAGPAV